MRTSSSRAASAGAGRLASDHEYREWLARPDYAETMSRRAEELYDIGEAEPDDDGLIELPLLPLRDMVMYPHMVTPLFVGREKSLAAIRAAQAANQTLLAVTQTDPQVEDPGPDDWHTVGLELAVGRMLRMPDSTTSVLAQGRRRVQVVAVTKTEPYYRAKARVIEEPTGKPRETEALMRAVLALFEKCVQLNRALPEEAYVFAMNIEEPGWLADLIASTINLDLAERQSILETFDPATRLQRISVLLGRELDVLELEDQIHSQVQNEVDRGQREMYLREQMKAIQTELGESDLWTTELGELRERITATAMPEEVEHKAAKELERLGQMPPMAPEVGIIRTYLDWLLDLPWAATTIDNLDLKHAATVLEREHFGLPKAKERILEYMAVRQLTTESTHAPILCFVGPPGTGKTSLGKSIAEALGRKFARLSLGGVRDEADIRGHRRTYVGALPGRLIQTMRRAGTLNPLLMLDEIDKLGQDFRGDPAAALLEVLDPEQNKQFVDHYLDVDYDLSQVMFITTANVLTTVPPALQDRLELIEFPGYVEEEKLNIARKYLIPRQMLENGLKDAKLAVTDGAVRRIVRSYTYEAGVRNLEREIANVLRKLARRKAEGKRVPARVTAEALHKYIGPPQYTPLEAEREDEVGVVTAVAWTEAGGDTMPIEVSLVPGKGGLQITGQVGEVMQESAQAAMSYLKARARPLAVEYERFDKTDTHIHIPEGAIPKDGPSAGISLATALISAFTGRKVHKEVGMTGEITLRGRVLPVGGVKEKVLAAHRAGLKKIILPKQNDKDLVDVPKSARRELKFVFVEHMEAVLAEALFPPPQEPIKPKARSAAKRPAAPGAKGKARPRPGRYAN
ncbi:MAG: endopeptidase La [Anaerolineales bacterium]|nr:endopeptidase La [Anaerolineales bacterium]